MKIAILGCGEYGLALANVFSNNGVKEVFGWSKFESEVLSCQEKYLAINFSTDLKVVTSDADLIVIAIPIAFLDDVMLSFKDVYGGQDILIASKGIDIDSQGFAYEIINKYLGNVNLGVISGGTFAKDMVKEKVMGITLGTKSDSIKLKVKQSFENNFLKVQYIDDIVGVSICGAIKNVMAIGFGLLDGADYPPSSKFLFLTEAIYEIHNLIEMLGGKSDTVMTYAGIDDIMMTCTSNQSRNYTLGNMLGKRLSRLDIDEYKKNTTIEGLGTSEAIYKLALSNDITLPIVSVIYKILYDNADVSELISLLERI